MAFKAGRGSSRAVVAWAAADVLVGGIALALALILPAADPVITAAGVAAVLAFQALLFLLGRQVGPR